MASSFFDGTEFAPETGKRKPSTATRKPASRAPRKSTLESGQPLDCSSCGLSENCLTPKMEPSGRGSSIMIVDNAPGAAEEKTSKPLMGDAGQIFRKALNNINISVDSDCVSTYVVQCRPSKDRPSTGREIKACYHRLSQQINTYNPKLIITLGIEAAKTVIQPPFKLGDEPMEVLQGKLWPSRKWNCWVACMPHPDVVLQNVITESDYQYMLRKLVLTYLDAKWPDEPKPQYKVITTIDELKTATDAILSSRSLNLDWETTGLSPFDTGADILCLGITSNIGNWCILFKTFDQNDYEFRSCIRRILESELPKSIQNAQFEMIWARNHMNMDIKNVLHDSMLAAHVLDERKLGTSLEYQTFAKWGFSYKGEVDRGNLGAESDDDLARYNTLDTYTSYELSMDQIRQMNNEDQIDPFRFLHRANYWMMRMKERGIWVNPKRVQEIRDDNKRNRAQFKKQIENLPSVQKYTKEKGEFNYASPDQLRDFLFNFMKVKSGKMTDGGQQSTDAEVMKNLQAGDNKEVAEFCSLLRALKSTEKMEGTYLKNFVDQQDPSNLLHPTFSLHTVRTYRSSSQ